MRRETTAWRNTGCRKMKEPLLQQIIYLLLRQLLFV